MRTKFWCGSLKGRDDSKDLSVGGKIILKWILKIFGRRLWDGSIWLRILTSGGLL
jgi:hypothetical protein